MTRAAGREASAPRERAPLRVLQLVPTLMVGGAERVAALLSRELRRLGHAVELVSLYDPFGTWIEAELAADGVPVRFLGKRPGLDARMVARIAAVVRRFRPDVVHTHMYSLQYALPAILARRCVAIHTMHNLAEREAHRPGRLVQQVAFRAGVVPVAIGDAVAESIRRVYRLRPRHTIPNGIPVAQYAAPPGAREELRAALGLPADAPVLATVGRLDLQKDTAALVRAFASERLRALGAHLLVAGDGPLRPQLEAQVRDLGVAGRVHLLGVRRDVPRVLAAADVFALASRYEGNPLTVMEAMAAGKPVVATAVGCVPELVQDGCGRLVAPGDEAALEAAMHALAAAPDLARAAGRRAALVARERFDDAAMARAYERVYRGDA
jgi:glycosyltransferase involved in cell wall biosynthesis